MPDPTVSDLARILADDTTMGTRLEVAWLEAPTKYAGWSTTTTGTATLDRRRFVGAVRYDAERNVIELVCCPPNEGGE